MTEKIFDFDETSDLPKNYLFLWEAIIPNGSKPGLYKFEDTASVLDFEDYKPVWKKIVTSTDEKTLQEIVDDPGKPLKKARIIGRTVTGLCNYFGKETDKILNPLDILDAQPEMKKRAIDLLIDREGGIQPIWNIEDGNFRSIAVTEETDAGLRIKGIGQIIRGTAAQILRGEALPDYAGLVCHSDSEPAPEQWAVLLRDIKEAAKS